MNILLVFLIKYNIILKYPGLNYYYEKQEIEIKIKMKIYINKVYIVIMILYYNDI